MLVPWEIGMERIYEHANNKELTNSTLTTGMEGHLRNCRGRLTNTTINWLQGGDIANRNNNGMSYVEDMVWHDSAFTHQLVRTGDIARTRDDDYPDVDNWELLEPAGLLYSLSSA